jgi:hypothetical protein
LTILRRLTVENGEPLLVCLTGTLGLKLPTQRTRSTDDCRADPVVLIREN